jgi:hypothetical protein
MKCCACGLEMGSSAADICRACWSRGSCAGDLLQPQGPGAEYLDVQDLAPGTPVLVEGRIATKSGAGYLVTIPQGSSASAEGNVYVHRRGIRRNTT